MTLGERIVHYRKRQGLSQEQLSQRLGVSRQSVSKWERDESLPEADKLPLLAKTLGVSLDALLSGEEEAPSQPAGPTPAKGGAVGKLAWLFRRWGWVGGLVLAAYGAFAFGLGLLARFLMGRCSRLWSCCCKPAGRCARPLWGSKSSPWPSW